MEMPPLGSVFAGHRLDAVAGRGGMGVVYRATDLRLGRTVALKLIASELSGDEGFRRRFERESRMAASIRHPHVITVFHAGEENGLLYVTMDYIEGTDLGALLKAHGRLGAAAAAGAVAQVASALDAAHARGLVHRDVKPANVLIETVDGRSQAILTDFGLTKLATSTSQITATGMFVGTIDYIAPEQLEGRPIDARADVYALGCVLYHLLTGGVPFPRDTQLATLYAHASAPPPSIRDVDSSLPAELDAVVRRAMAKSPEERFPSAGDLGRAAIDAASGTHTASTERSVARGEAATGAAPTAPAVVGAESPAPRPPEPPRQAEPPPPEAAPVRAPTPPPAEPSQPKTPPRRGLIAAAVAAAAAVVVVALVLILSSGGDGGSSGADKKNQQAAAGASEPKVDKNIPAGSVANVGDAHITAKQFQHWKVAAAKQAEQGKGRTSDSKLRDQTMQFLISAEWLTRESDRRGIEATDAEVQKTFEKQKKQSFPKESDYREFVRTSGQSEADLLYRVKLSVLTNKLQKAITTHAKVTDQDVQDYYNKNKSRFAQPETRDLLVVLTKQRADAETARVELEDGAPWSRVAAAYSTDQASKSQGGKLPGVSKGQQEKVLDKAIFAASEDELVGPVKTQFGYYVFKVTRVRAGKQQSLDEARETIRNLLESQAQQKALDDFVADFQKRYRSITWCAEDYVIPQCANSKEPPKKSTTPGLSGP